MHRFIAGRIWRSWRKLQNLCLTLAQRRRNACKSRLNP